VPPTTLLQRAALLLLSAFSLQPSAFPISRRATGYHNAAELLAFLDDAPEQTSTYRGFLDAPADFFKRRGFFVILLFILAGGFLLNLTPCVLPLIPINLALIGAGAQNATRKRGFFMGGAYALGIALAYGGLGVAAVLSGAMFGGLQSSPWFSLTVALVFVLLGLALLGVFNIDFARFQKNTASAQTFFAAFGAGAASALLAGACVAPVVAAVLLLSSTLYNEGVFAALFLPLLLGVGMALPWPFAGAGLSLLPRPGAWMRFIKIPFALLVLLLALNYAFAAWQGFRPATGGGDSVSPAEFYDAIGRNEGKPVFVDVWATWCKNCLLMERTTFKNPRVRERLNDFHVIKLQAENPKDPATAELLRELGVSGLPTFLIFQSQGETP